MVLFNFQLGRHFTSPDVNKDRKTGLKYPGRTYHFRTKPASGVSRIRTIPNAGRTFPLRRSNEVSLLRKTLAFCFPTLGCNNSYALAKYSLDKGKVLSELRISQSTI